MPLSLGAITSQRTTPPVLQSLHPFTLMGSPVDVYEELASQLADNNRSYHYLSSTISCNIDPLLFSHECMNFVFNKIPLTKVVNLMTNKEKHFCIFKTSVYIYFYGWLPTKYHERL